MISALFIEITDPNGTRWDLTDRLSLDDVSSLTEEVEDDLTVLTYSDISLVLDDRDGVVSGIFSGARRGDLFDVRIERETGARRPKWERLFGGVVTFPLGYRRDTKEAVVELQAYSYAKIAELYSAENLMRSFSATGSVVAGNSTITLSSSTTLSRNDRITLTGSTANQEFTILSVDSSTQITATSASSYTFVGVPVTLDTPYYRDQTLSFLVSEIAAESGFSDTHVDVSQALASVPFPSDPVTTGLPTTVPASTHENASNQLCVWSGTTVTKYTASSVTSGFTSAGAETAKTDWTPYKTTAPATARAANGADDGTRCWDHDSGDYYELTINGSQDLVLQKNGVDLVTVSLGGTGGGASNTWNYALDFNEMDSEVWVSYHHVKETSGGGITINSGSVVRYSTAGSLLGAVRGDYCSLRCCAAQSVMAVMPWTLLGDTPDNDGASGVLFYSGSTQTGSLDCDAGLVLWTFRAFDTFYACVRSSGGTHVQIWSQDSSELISDAEISASSGSRNIACVFNAGGTAADQYFGYAGGEWFVVSTQFSAVIPYADFSGKSCAAALRELAVMSGAHLIVDEHKTLRVIGRDSDPMTSSEPIELDEPIEQTFQPVWEWIRDGITVSGRDENGDEVSASTGDTGDSAITLDVSCDLPLTSGLAGALASSYRTWLSPSREQLDEVIEEPARRVRVLDLVTRDGRTYKALRVETDLVDMTQRVQLAEIV